MIRTIKINIEEKDFKKLERAKEHYNMNWAEFFIFLNKFAEDEVRENISKHHI